MRRVILILSVLLATVSPMAFVCRADDPDQPTDRRTRREQRRLLLRQREEIPDLNEFQRRWGRDNEQVERAWKNAQDKWQQYQLHSDHNTFREWRAAEDKYLAEKRGRDEAIGRFARRWQREHPGVPIPTTPGTPAPPPPSPYARTPQPYAGPLSGLLPPRLRLPPSGKTPSPPDSKTPVLQGPYLEPPAPPSDPIPAPPSAPMLPDPEPSGPREF